MAICRARAGSIRNASLCKTEHANRSRDHIRMQISHLDRLRRVCSSKVTHFSESRLASSKSEREGREWFALRLSLKLELNSTVLTYEVACLDRA